MPGAGLGLVWLDGRAMKGGHDDSGEMSLRAAMYGVDGTQTAEAALDTRICECCPTAVAVTSKGPIVAYRDRSADEIRDLYVSRLEQGRWTEGRPVHADGWKINACPVNGPALSANGPRVAIAWFNAKNDDGHAFAAFSSDSGQTFGSPIRLDDINALERVDIALLQDGSAMATWIEFAEQRAQFKMRRVEASGNKSAASVVSALAAGRASGYPRLASFGQELVFAWTDAGQPSRVLTAVATAPQR